MKMLTDRQRTILRAPIVRELKRLDKLIRASEARRDRILDQYVRRFAPMRVGDVVRYRSSTGRLGCVRVTSVRWYGQTDPHWGCYGTTCRQDGTPMMRRKFVSISERSWNADCAVVRRA